MFTTGSSEPLLHLTRAFPFPSPLLLRQPLQKHNQADLGSGEYRGARQSELRHHSSSVSSSLTPSSSLSHSYSPLPASQPASLQPTQSQALKSPALILRINKPCAERCSQPRLFSAPLCFFFPSPPLFPGPKCLHKKRFPLSGLGK